MNKGLALMLGGDFQSPASQLKAELRDLNHAENELLHIKLLADSQDLLKKILIEGRVTPQLRKEAIAHLKVLKVLDDGLKNEPVTLKLIK